jgi:hypothetical protein
LVFLFLAVSFIAYDLLDNITKTNMTSLAEELLLQEKSGETSSGSDGGPGVIHYAHAKETALCRIGDVLPGQASANRPRHFNR